MRAKSDMPDRAPELERVLELPGGGRRYWLKRGGRWQLWKKETT